MEYIYNVHLKKWYNTELMQYEDNFDSSSNINRIKISRDKHVGPFSSKFAYRDISDIKLILNDGTLFGACDSNNLKSAFILGPEVIMNPKILKNVNEDYKYLKVYIETTRDCSRPLKYKMYQTFLYDDGRTEADVERAKIDRTIKAKLTTEQRLYIEVNRNALGLDNF